MSPFSVHMDDYARIQGLYVRINELSQRGLWDEVKECCDELSRIAPGDGFAWYCLGEIALTRGQLAEASGALRQATALAPGNMQYLRSYAAALQMQGDWQQSALAFRQILNNEPGDVAAWRRLAFSESVLGRPEQAAWAYERCLAQAPDRDDIAVEFADSLCRVGEAKRSLEIARKVTARNPTYAAAWTVMGTAFLLLRNWQEAAHACQNAIRFDSQNRQAGMLLAVALMRLWLLPEAEEVVRKLLNEEPRNADAWALLGTLLKMQAKAEEAIGALQQAVAVGSEPSHQSLLLQTWQYVEGQTAKSLLDVHRKWATDQAVQTQLAQAPAGAHRQRSGPLRLGFVSGDLGVQATSYLALPLVESLDKSECSITCYSDRTEGADAVTGRFRAAANQWRDTRGWPSANLVQQIRADEIEILVDLMGHTGSRMDVFATRAAPMQVTWMGYVGTTGLSSMDYILADKFHIRPGEEDDYVERVLRMPNGYVCYSPIFETPEPSPLPSLERGFVTFGCFNNPTKYTSSTLNGWAEILHRVPHARLFLKFGGLQHAEIQNRIRSQFAERGIPPDRLSFEGWSPVYEVLASYQRVDMALDTQPFSGCVTTCEALWMGVPVITWPGETFAGRQSTSHLTNAGYPQFVAADAAGYIELAVEWANRVDELAVIRSQMRDQVCRSALCDARRFANDFLAVLREAWECQ